MLGAFRIPDKFKGFTIGEDSFRFALGLEKWGEYEFGTNFLNITWMFVDYSLGKTMCFPSPTLSYQDNNYLFGPPENIEIAMTEEQIAVTAEAS